MVRRSALLALLIVLFVARPAFAHDVRGEVIFLDIGERAVDLELRVPVMQLAYARGESLAQLAAEPSEALAADARAYVAASDRAGRRFALDVQRVARERDPDGGQMIVFGLRLAPPAGSTARWFALADELVLRRVVTDNIYVFLRRDLQSGALGESPSLLGEMHYQQRTLAVDRTAGSWRSALAAAFALGTEHIRTGTDHLLFLLMLLIVAPLAGRSWRQAASFRTAILRTAGIATAFTIGHSCTLALGALTAVAIPARAVECLIAISILISALHAWRPMFAGKEPIVAAGFGLVHGLAFATALTGFGFDRPSLVLALFGFNLGVEAMQLAVIACIVPSLIALAAGRHYARVRRAAALIGGLASLMWLFDRVCAVEVFSPWLERAARHGIWVAVALAVAAIGSRIKRKDHEVSTRSVSPAERLGVR